MNVNEIDAASVRTPGHPNTAAHFRDRWSPRAMAGTGVSDSQLQTLFEAARWAPSCFNAQPWRFLYAHRDSANWSTFFDAIIEANQRWAAHAGILIAVISRRTFAGGDKPNPAHSFDAGAAWMSLALEASRLGLVCHGMRGFDEASARTNLQVPEDYEINAFVAIGNPGEISTLPQGYQDKESPSPRAPLASLSVQGAFDRSQLEAT